MTKRELVSIVLPLYNREKTIERAVKSVLNQTYTNLELIVVDDCSSDRSVDIVNAIDDKRLRIVKLKKNGGACRARNRGIDEANGEYIAFQDSDDEWALNKLEIQLNALKNSKADVNFCAFNRVSKKKSTRIPKRDFKISKQGKWLAQELLKDNFISTQTILAKREVFRKVRFDEKLPRFQDWDLAIRLAQNYTLSYVDNSLVNVYIQDDSITRNGKKGLKALEILLNKYSDICERNPEIMRAFLYKKCILGYKSGMNMRTETKKYLRGGFNLKIFYVWLWSMLKKRKRSEQRERNIITRFRTWATNHQPVILGVLVFLLLLVSMVLHYLAGPGDLWGVNYNYDSGFFSDSIDVELYADGPLVPKLTKLRYTLNGDDPSVSGKVYDEPIRLEKKDDISVYTITAAFCYARMKCGTPVTKTYVLGDNLSDDVDLDFISITSARKNLYDYDTGIMVKGKTYDDNVASGKYNGRLMVPGNYSQRGDEWVRDAHVTMLGAGTGEVLLDTDLGIAISGNTSAALPVKSIKLAANKKYGYEKFVFDFGGSGTLNSDLAKLEKYNSIRLRSGAQDQTYGNIRSSVVSRLAEQAGFPGCTATKRVIVYLNGKYYGIFDAQQNYSDSFLTKRFNLNESDMIIKAKGAELSALKDAGLMDLFNADLNDRENKEKLEAKVDMDDYLRYYALEILWNNTDWPQNSFEMWRYTGTADRKNKYSDGRFRFLVYDTDLTYQTEQSHVYFKYSNGDTFESIMENRARAKGSTLVNVLKSDYYREKFIDILREYINGALRTENVLSVIESEANVIDRQMRVNYSEARYDIWREQIDLMKKAASERNDAIKIDIKKYFNVDL